MTTADAVLQALVERLLWGRSNRGLQRSARICPGSCGHGIVSHRRNRDRLNNDRGRRILWCGSTGSKGCDISHRRSGSMAGDPLYLMGPSSSSSPPNCCKLNSTCGGGGGSLRQRFNRFKETGIDVRCRHHISSGCMMRNVPPNCSITL